MAPRKRGIYRESYFKVSRRVFDSSLWCEPGDTIKVFLMLVALAQDPGGPRDGTVFIARKLLAAKCLMTEESLDTHISILSAPDPQSRTQAENGRRIEIIPNGYRVVNHTLYHDKTHDLTLSRARSRAGRIGGEKSASSRRIQQLTEQQNASKPEANSSNGDGDGDGEETETITTPHTPQGGRRRRRSLPTLPTHPDLPRFLLAFNRSFGRDLENIDVLNAAFHKREGEGISADTLVALPILLAAQVAQGLDELKSGPSKLNPGWLLRDGSGRYAGQDGGTRNTKDWIGSILGLADQTTIGPELMPLVDELGLRDTMHKLGVKRKKVAC